MKLAVRGGSWLGATEVKVEISGFWSDSLDGLHIKRGWEKVETLRRDQVQGLEQVTEEKFAAWGKKAVVGTLGAVALGPVGLVAGALIAGNKKKWLALLTFKDSRKLVLECNPDQYRALWSLLGEPEVARVENGPSV
ncbi:MAG: hypothetical protein AB1942_16985 [Pseudomonadota bacterium]